MPLFGAHMSIAGGYHLALLTSRDHGCETVQIFTKAPSQWAGKPILPEEALLFRRTLRETRLKLPIAHDSYLINLASPDEALYRKSIEAFVDELRRAEMLGIKYLVTHPGAHLGAGEEEGIIRVVAALDEALCRCAGFKIQVLLETTAGQGTTLGHRFEHLRDIICNVAEPNRVGVCLDTCHVLAAGYALSPEREYHATFREFGRLIGFGKLKAFHVNDSLKPRGSRVDRHAHIGQGCLGLEPFRLLVNDPRFRSRPMVLETAKESGESDDMDAVNLSVLRGLLAPAR
ncbi:MAG TPA: deoxyribonuclease IV [Gemmataceae bacterium]|nr:deoxyribonuclease IV [Gemmataceae bacterium]